MIKTLRCGHTFHTECIDPWLINERALCGRLGRCDDKNEVKNLLEESQSRDIDILLTRIGKRKWVRITSREK